MIIYKQKTWEIKKKTNLLRFLQKEGINPEEVLVIKNGKVITEDEMIFPSDEVKIIPVTRMDV